MREHLHSFAKLEFDKVIKHIQRYALSDLGREHLERLIPSSDLSEIRHNLALVTEMKSLIVGDEYPPLENLYDIRSSIQRSSIENFVLTSEELNRIALVLDTSQKIHLYFAKRKSSYPLLVQKVIHIHIEKLLAYNIHQAIDEEGKLRDSASKELTTIRRQITEKRVSLRKSLESILKSISGKDWIQEEIITTREGRMVIPVKAEHKNRVPGFIHISSSSGATVFVEPTVTLELNNEIRTLEFQEQREIEKILRGLTQQLRDVNTHLLDNISILGELDFIQSKAKYSIETLGNEPILHEEKKLKISNGYHPILLQRHKRNEIVPLDFEVGDDIRTLIITGPNAGGKSVAMKTVGLLSLLAQSGCHIPASPESEITLLTDVFVDMGDEQSIENDLSSFSSHLGNLKYILGSASDTSIVLIDEICSGTDPTEGASLAAAILERLTEIGCITIVTTHHGSLKTFAFENPNIENAAMEFDQATLSPTYRFKVGIPGSSYAIEMAERIAIPDDIIKRSRELKGTQANKLEDLIADLEHQSQELRSSLDRVSKEKEQLHELTNDYTNKISMLKTEIKQIKSSALAEARAITENANATIERVVRDIREQSAHTKAVKVAKEKVEQLRENIQILTNEVDLPPIVTEFPIGASVRLKHGDAAGKVVSKLDDRHYLLHIGELKVKVNALELEYSSAITSNYQQPIIKSMLAEIKHEVDLRGMYGDEAIAAVEKLLDDAILHGLHRIDIIHGKGTGALRKKVTEYLKKNAAVKSFRLGEWNEGGAGVTVVELL